MFKNIFLLCGLILLIGCSTVQKHTIGGYHDSMETGMSIYHQYVSTKIKQINEKFVKYNTVFETDLDEDISSDIVDLYISILVINPYKQKFEIFENLEFKDLGTDEVYLSVHSQVIFSVDVLDKSGKKLDSSYVVKYKTGSKNN